MGHFLSLDLQLERGFLLGADVNRYPDEFACFPFLVLQTAAARDDPTRSAMRQHEPVLALEGPL